MQTEPIWEEHLALIRAQRALEADIARQQYERQLRRRR